MVSSSTPKEPNAAPAFEMKSVPKSSHSNGILEQMKNGPINQEPSDSEKVRDQVSPPEAAVEAKQRWNHPRLNMWKVFATFFSFLVLGMNDGSYGVRLI